MPLYFGSTHIPALSVLNPLTEVKQCNHISVEQATPSITVSDSGLITAQTIQSEGLVSSGTKSATMQLSVQEAKTITPSASEQTAVESGKYTMGVVVVAGDENLKAENIAEGVSIFGVVGNHSGGSGDSDALLAAVIDRSVTELTIPNGCTRLGMYALRNCESLVTLNFPDSLTYIASHSCYACTSLSSLTIPKGVTEINSYAFYGATALTEVTFKGTPNTIANNIFNRCTALKTINVPWAEGAVANAPWGASSATINYNS